MKVQKLGPKLAIDDYFNYEVKKEIINKRPYELKSIDNIYKNKNNIAFLDKIMNSSAKKIFVIRGHVGSGKTEFVKLYLKSKNYKFNLYDNDTEDITELTRAAVSSSIEKFFGDIEQKAIIVKNYTEIKKYQELMKFLEQKKTIPIFLITSDFSITAVKNCPKFATEIIFECPGKADFIELGLRIANYYSKSITEYTITKIMNMCKDDTRSFVKNIEFLCQNEEHGNITVKKDFKDIIYNVKEKLEIISNKDIAFEKKLKEATFHTNSVTHENLVSFLENSFLGNSFLGNSFLINKNLSDSLKTVSDSYDYTIDSLYISSYINRYQCWDNVELLDCCNILGSIAPLTLIRNFNKENSIAKLNKITIKEELSYESNIYSSSDFNKISEAEYILKYVSNDPENYVKGITLSEDGFGCVLRNLNRCNSVVPKRQIEKYRKIYKESHELIQE